MSLVVCESKILISQGTQTDLKGKDLSELIAYWETGARVPIVASQISSGESSSQGGSIEGIAEWAKERLGPQSKSALGTKVLSHKAIIYWSKGDGANLVQEERQGYRVAAS